MEDGHTVSPAGDQIEDFVDAGTDAIEDWKEQILEEGEESIRAENDAANAPAQIVGPPAPPPQNWEAAKARGERFGEAVRASEAAETELTAAQSRLQVCQQAEVQLRTESASYEELSEARQATSDAQLGVWQAQSRVDVADLNLRAARHECELAEQLQATTGVTPPDVLSEQALEEVVEEDLADFGSEPDPVNAPEGIFRETVHSEELPITEETAVAGEAVTKEEPVRGDEISAAPNEEDLDTE